MASPTIYMIRHGEKPGNDGDGLSIQGTTRAQYLPQVFGKLSTYNIGYIMAEHKKKDGSRARPYDTVHPLAQSLNLEINSSIHRNDADGAAKAAKAYQGPGNILICWEHNQLAEIAKELGVKRFKDEKNGKKVDYPDDRFDLIWTVPPPYTEITDVVSEDVPGLDDQKK